MDAKVASSVQLVDLLPTGNLLGLQVRKADESHGEVELRKHQAMTKSLYCKLLTLLEAQIKEQDRVNSLLKEVLKSYSDLSEFYLDNPLIDQLVKLLDDQFPGDWASWYLYEDVEKLAWFEEVDYEVNTPEKLWDFIQLSE